MATDVNTVTVSGNLTKDAEVRYTQSGYAIVGFSIATNHAKKVGEKWEDEAHFFEVTLFGREKLAPYLIKGKKIFVSGRLEQQRWEKDGQKRSAVKIVADQIVLAGERGDSGKAPVKQQENDVDDGEFFDALPF